MQIHHGLHCYSKTKTNMFVVTKKAVGALLAAKPLFPSAVSEKACTAIMQIHHGLRRFFRRPFANHAKTNSYPLNTRNDAKEEDKWDDTRLRQGFGVAGK